MIIIIIIIIKIIIIIIMDLYFTQDKDTYPMLHTNVYEYCKT